MAPRDRARAWRSARDFRVGTTGAPVIAGAYDRARSPRLRRPTMGFGRRTVDRPSSREPEGLLHEKDVLLDVVHRRGRVVRDRPRAFDLDEGVAAATRRARGCAEAFTVLAFGFGRRPFTVGIQRGLSRSQPGDGHAIWRTAHVVETEVMTELHGTGFPAVFLRRSRV